MRVDAMGRLGLAVIRLGAPVEGLRPGDALEVLYTDKFTFTLHQAKMTIKTLHGRCLGHRGHTGSDT